METTMAEVSSTYARAHLSEILRRVAGGESITITRRGTPIAVLTPIKRRAESLAQFRAKHGQVEGSALEELLAMRNEDR